MAYFLKD